jgi:hypothetical protein
MLPILAAMAGMAIDVGSYASDRTSLQNAADSMALAAAQELPDTSAATNVAHEFAKHNNIDVNDVELKFTGQSPGVPNPKVRVTITHSHEFAFMKVVGINDKDVKASASSIKSSYGGGDGIVPFAVTETLVTTSLNGDLVTLKYDSGGASTGNFGVIGLDGTGSSTYEDSAMYGSTSDACAVGTPDCTAASGCPEPCAETADGCDGPDCTLEPGNMTGATRDAVDYRMENATAACDTFEETFDGPDATGKYFLDPQCNPWIDGGEGGTRVIIIPIVDKLGLGASGTSTITGFALLYLEGYNPGACIGSSCEIQGRFVRADISANALAGTYNETALIQFTRLDE